MLQDKLTYLIRRGIGDIDNIEIEAVKRHCGIVCEQIDTTPNPTWGISLIQSESS